MALFVFLKNFDNIEGTLVGISESQSALDNNWSYNSSDYDIVTVEDDLYNKVRLIQKRVLSKNGESVNTEDVAFKFAYRAELTDYINSTINKINEWLKLNSSKPLASVATTYRDYISNINVDSLITDPSSDATFSDGAFSDGTPLNSSLEKYVEDQGVTAIHCSQLL